METVLFSRAAKTLKAQPTVFILGPEIVQMTGKQLTEVWKQKWLFFFFGYIMGKDFLTAQGCKKKKKSDFIAPRKSYKFSFFVV